MDGTPTSFWVEAYALDKAVGMKFSSPSRAFR